MARYMEGYAIADRYDLGEFPQGPNKTVATKYGKATQLEMMVDMLHDDNIKVQMDLVPNQMLGLNQREAVFVRRATSSGEPFTNPFTGGEKKRRRSQHLTSLIQKVAVWDKQNMVTSKNGTNRSSMEHHCKGRGWAAS